MLFEIPVEESAKMLQCKMPIVAGGLYSGSYYEVEKKGRYIKNVIRHSRH